VKDWRLFLRRLLLVHGGPRDWLMLPLHEKTGIR
jgi:hypothetical protein